MKKNLRTTRVLIIDAAMVMLFSILLVLANFFLLDHANDNLKRIDDLHSRKLEIILRMTNIVRERSMMMLTMYVEDDFWKLDEEFLVFHKFAVDFIKLREMMLATGLTEGEQMEFDKAMAIIRITQPLQENIVVVPLGFKREQAFDHLGYRILNFFWKFGVRPLSRLTRWPCK